MRLTAEVAETSWRKWSRGGDQEGKKSAQRKRKREIYTRLVRVVFCRISAPKGNYCREIDLIDTIPLPNGLTTIRRNRLCLARGHAARLVPLSPCTDDSNHLECETAARTTAICAARKWDRII